MMPYCVLFLLVSFAAVVTSQTRSPACTDARDTLIADQVCLTASNAVEEIFTRDSTRISNVTLNNFCSSNCRGLNIRISVDCAGEPSDAFTSDTIDLVCMANSGGSCTQLFSTPQFTSIGNSFGASGDCQALNTSGTCTPGCAMLFQNFTNVAGCCTAAIIDLGSQITEFNANADQVFTACNINPPQGSPCQVIGGGSGGGELKAYGGLLLFAVIISAVF